MSGGAQRSRRRRPGQNGAGGGCPAGTPSATRTNPSRHTVEVVGNVLSSPEWREYFKADQSELGDELLPVLLTVGAVLSLAGLVLITWIAGWDNVWRTLLDADWVFALAAPVAVAVSHLGYTLAYRKVAQA